MVPQAIAPVTGAAPTSLNDLTAPAQVVDTTHPTNASVGLPDGARDVNSIPAPAVLAPVPSGLAAATPNVATIAVALSALDVGAPDVAAAAPDITVAVPNVAAAPPSLTVGAPGLAAVDPGLAAYGSGFTATASVALGLPAVDHEVAAAAPAPPGLAACGGGVVASVVLPNAAAAGTEDSVASVAPSETPTAASENDDDAQWEAEDDDEDESDGEMPLKDSLFYHAHRKATTRAERRERAGGKSGNPGRFSGPQFVYLDTFVSAYNQIPKGRRGKNLRLDRFWHSVRGGFWGEFHWKKVRDGMKPECQQWTRSEVVKATNAVSTARTMLPITHV